MASGLYTQFQGYRSVSSDELDSAIKDATIVFDTNALLHLYTYQGEMRDAYLTVLKKFGKRLFIPHHVIDEFWRTRLLKLRDLRRDDHEVNAISELLSEIEKKYNSWHRRAINHDTPLSGELNALRSAGTILLDSMADAAGSENDVTVDTPTYQDPVILALAKILDQKVGDRPSPEELKVMETEGNRRLDLRIPPGYIDARKESKRSLGDFLIWEQTLREIESRGDKSNLLFVTQDNKEDWWLYPGTSEKRARPELTEEYSRRIGGKVFLIRTIDLLAKSKILNVDVSAEAIRQARTQETTSWNVEKMSVFLAKLREYSFSRYEIIQKLCDSTDGTISRKNVAQVMNLEPSDSLRGITQPLSTIMSKLVDSGIIEASLPLPLEVEKGKFTKASIPNDLLPIVRAALEEVSKGTQDTIDTHFYIRASNGAWAKGKWDEDGFLIIEGEFRAEPTTSCGASILQLRSEMLSNGSLLPTGENGLCRLTAPHLFSKPSQASSAVLFANTNGYDKWKTNEGRTLQEFLKRDESE